MTFVSCDRKHLWNISLFLESKIPSSVGVCDSTHKETCILGEKSLISPYKNKNLISSDQLAYFISDLFNVC
jgi:hypothetical protein